MVTPTYFPYGEVMMAGGIAGQEQFATYVRDSTPSAQDYAEQRYYSNNTGRFFSPDPSMLNADLANPASWNKYSYTNGDPANNSDPTGLISLTPSESTSFCATNPANPECWYSADGGCAYRGGQANGFGGMDWEFITCTDGNAEPQAPYAQLPPTCEQALTATISAALAGTPLAQEASDFVEDAQYGGLNPYLLVAIAGAESSYGANIAPGSNNPFGLLHGVKGANGKVRYVPINYGNWNDAINGAVSTVDKQFVNGNVTVSEMYSGLPGAYCVGPGCSAGAANVASIFKSLGGGNPNNPLDLLWPCNH